MKSGLETGAVYEFSLTVTPDMQARLTTDVSEEVVHPRLYATAQMINHMEWAARQHIKPLLESGEEGVGHHIDVRHLAPAPVGGHIRIRAVVTEILDNKVTTDTEAWYDSPQGPVLVGKGRVTQAIIPVNLLHQRAGLPEETLDTMDMPVFLTEPGRQYFGFEMLGAETPFPCTRYDEWMVCRVRMRQPNQPDFDYQGAFLLLYEAGEWLAGLQQLLNGERTEYHSGFLEPFFVLQASRDGEHFLLRLRFDPAAIPGTAQPSTNPSAALTVSFTLSHDQLGVFCHQLQAHIRSFPSSL